MTNEDPPPPEDLAIACHVIISLLQVIACLLIVGCLIEFLYWTFD